MRSAGKWLAWLQKDWTGGKIEGDKGEKCETALPADLPFTPTPLLSFGPAWANP